MASHPESGMTEPDHDLQLPHTRTSAAWTLAAAGAVLGLLMLVFIFQNSDKVPVSFLWLDGNVPLGAALLLASVIGALIVLLIGAGRLFQLRLMARRHRRADHGRRAVAADPPPAEPVPGDPAPPEDDGAPGEPEHRH